MQINFGVVMNEAMGDEVKITVIATGFERENLPAIERRTARAAAPSVPEHAPPTELPEPEPVYAEAAAPEPVYEEPQMTMQAAASAPAHDPLFDDLDVPAILRRRMVQ